MGLCLYHGTSDECFAKIVLSRGNIKRNNHPDCTIDSETDLLDDLIKQYIGKNIREGCIYLTDEYAYTVGYDYAFTIDVKELDLEKLYISKNGIAEGIRKLYYTNAGDIEISKLVKEYHDALIPYKKYLKEHLYYENAEYLYFSDITVDITETDIEESKKIKKDLHLD